MRLTCTWLVMVAKVLFLNRQFDDTQPDAFDDVEARSEKRVSSGASTNEEPIVESLRSGDFRNAIALSARIYQLHLGRLAFLMLRTQAEADEVVQETLLAAYDQASSFRFEATVRAWLFGILRKICARRLDVRQRQARRSHLLSDVQTSESTDSTLDRLREEESLRKALSELKPTEREALLLRYEGDLSFRDVAFSSGVDEATARKRVSRALLHLRELLERA